MKKIIFILLILTSLTNIYSQKNQALDTKNGFRQFRLGSAPSQIANIQQKESIYSKNPNVKEYNYIGKDIEYVANVKVYSITLEFYKNKLSNISIQFGGRRTGHSLSDEEYIKIKDYLQVAYGPGEQKYYKEDTYIIGFSWSGTKVALDFNLISLPNTAESPNEPILQIGSLSIWDKALTREIYSSEF
jgi:hypothetical protein